MDKIQCTYTVVIPKSKGGLKTINEVKRGVLIGFSNWPGQNLLGIIVNEQNKIIQVDVAGIKVL